jgi:hypothetical protein
MSRKSKFPDHEHVHRRTECPRHFVRDRDAAPGEREDYQVGAVGEMVEPARENYAGVSSIAKSQGIRRLPWNGHARVTCNHSAFARTLNTGV